MSDPLNELRSLLNDVEPSVGFAARTRARAIDATRRTGARTWRIAIPALAAAALAVVTIVPALRPAVPHVAEPPAVPAARAAEPAPSRPVVPPVVRAARSAAPVRTVFRTEVIAVAERDQEVALRRLLFAMQTEEGVVPTAPVETPISIQPIDVKPLPSFQVLQSTTGSGGTKPGESR
jgi:hypothetical protein